MEVSGRTGRLPDALHALLVALTPGYQDEIGALTNQRALTAARRRVAQARIVDPVRAKLALAAITRVRSLDREVQALTGDVTEAIAARRPTHLLALRGVGTGTIAPVECLADGEWRHVADLAVPRHGLAVVGVGRDLRVISGVPEPGLAFGREHEVFDDRALLRENDGP
jgi:hypothetical protein